MYAVLVKAMGLILLAFLPSLLSGKILTNSKHRARETIKRSSIRQLRVLQGKLQTTLLARREEKQNKQCYIYH